MKLLLISKLALGALALLLGTVGLFFPVWPTTPFVLLAVGCFSATPGIQRKLLEVRFVREYYESYTEGRGLRRKTVAVSLSFLWGMLLVSSVLVGRLWVAALLFGIGAAVTAHILWIARER